MDNWLELLLPLIFIALYIFGNRGQKKKEEGEESAAPSRRPQSEGGEADADAEARRIQEEIRRLIVARQGRGEESGEGERGTPTPAAQPLRREVQQPQRSMEAAPGHRAASERGVTAPKSMDNIHDQGRRRELIESNRSPGSQVLASERSNAALRRIEEQEADIQDKERQTAALRAQARQLQEKTSAVASDLRRRTLRTTSDGSLDRGAIKQLLRNPQSTRHAFLLTEILGTPVGQRRNDAITPVWRS
jgi:hypothetical protein